MPQGVTIVDDDKVRRMEEQMRLDPRIATLYGKREEAKATAATKRAEVESLERTSRSTADPKARQETDALLTEAKKALAEAQEEDRRATEEINRAEKEWKALNDAKARAEQARPGASAGGSAAR
jgi:chromosome segregation ATPase